MASTHPHKIAGYAADALHSLTPSQIKFLQALPKAELHAHLNGSIPLSTLQKLAHDYHSTNAHAASEKDVVRAGIERLQRGVVLSEIHEFFGLFPAIYALTSTPDALEKATNAVMHHFLGDSLDEYPQAAYLELRTTPRETPSMSRLQYLETVLNQVEKYPEHRAALIVSLDRRMSSEVAAECVDCAVKLKARGRRVVGMDLCGDVTAGNVADFEQHFRAAKAAGLGVTLHIAEIEDTPADEIHKLLSFKPDRLGHATFLDDASKEAVRKSNACIEICLSSNLLCKTVHTLDIHHIRYYLQHDHPIAICTDDILPFRNSLLGEYALLMAAPPLGLGLTEAEIHKVAQMGMDCRFPSTRKPTS
ncbi:Metallo-dependent hydrolase [Laetiporus sulphureus 93-53]|uniref:Metallo-dependent hydrolase n=1 Tax=Laetiporus sulphureus 93-53 TaxID=1314785 RepID=A0A165FJ92_9APHY|nr:Metallo-dependent hydrolase [Laetiporus sulphureus 93-53]KZT09056.1 Metallo-dependent hydrolase [Laetiporus sulphureus 93-53]